MKKTRQEQTLNIAKDKDLNKLIVSPLETNHVFNPKSSDEYYCSVCSRCRAFHTETGFRPSTLQSHIDREAIIAEQSYGLKFEEPLVDI